MNADVKVFVICKEGDFLPLSWIQALEGQFTLEIVDETFPEYVCENRDHCIFLLKSPIFTAKKNKIIHKIKESPYSKAIIALLDESDTKSLLTRTTDYFDDILLEPYTLEELKIRIEKSKQRLQIERNRNTNMTQSNYKSYVLKILSESANDYIGLPPDADLYCYIGRKLIQITGDNSFIFINKYDNFENTLYTKSITGNEYTLRQISQIAKIKFKDISYPLPQDIKDVLMTGRLHTVKGGLRELTFNRLSQKLSSLIERKFNLGKIYSMGFTIRGQLYGNVVIIRQKDEELSYPELVEAFIHQAAIALHRHVAESNLQYRIQIEKLVADISAQFINSRSNDLNVCIMEVIKSIGEFTNVDRAVLIIFDGDDYDTGQTFDWNSESRPDEYSLKDICLRELEFFSRLLNEGKCVVLNKIDQLPNDAKVEREWFRQTNYGSILVVPLVYSNKLYGVFCLSNKVGYEARWHDLMISLLKSVVNMIVTSYEKKVIEDKLLKTNERYTLATTSARVGVWDVNLSTYEIYIDPIISKFLGYEEEITENLFNNYENFIDKEDFKRAEDIINVHLKNRNNGFSVELPIKNKHGDRKWMLFQGRAIIDRKKNLKRILGTSTDISMLKEVEEELKKSQKQLRELIVHSQSLIEDERKLIAREIHDELGQVLAALKMDLSWLKGKLSQDEERVFNKMNDIFSLLDRAVRSVKSISANLRPDVLDNLGLAAAIEWQTENFQRCSGIRCHLVLNPEDLTLDKTISIAVFRIFQETMTNISRHARASEVDVKLEKTNGFISLSVRDNGVGIDSNQVLAPDSFGLIGMRERAQSLGGDITIISTPGNGTTIEVQIPYNKEDPKHDEDINRR